MNAERGASRSKGKHKELKRQTYTKEELECMLISCKYTKVSETVFRKKFKMQRPSATRDTAILLCLLDTGMRASEICSLNVGDLDINTGKVTIKHGSEGGAKGGTGRTVFIGKKSRKYLWKYLNDREELRDTDPLFISQTTKLKRKCKKRTKQGRPQAKR